VLLWLLAATGMLWAHVDWVERFYGLGGFHRLLMIPLLFAQFRRSEHGIWVLYGFLTSAGILLLASWAMVLLPKTWWPVHANANGVLVKDYISQSTIFEICAFALISRACDLLRERNRWAPLWPLGL